MYEPNFSYCTKCNRDITKEPKCDRDDCDFFRYVTNLQTSSIQLSHEDYQIMRQICLAKSKSGLPKF